MCARDTVCEVLTFSTRNEPLLKILWIDPDLATEDTTLFIQLVHLGGRKLK